MKHAVYSFVLLALVAICGQAMGHSPNASRVGEWVYFVSGSESAVFNIDGNSGTAQFTNRVDGETVVESMDLKYIGDDKTRQYFKFQNDVMAGAKVWYLPKAQRGHVYSSYQGTPTTKITYYGPSVRFHPATFAMPVSAASRPAAGADKKVRITNATTDCDIRVWCVRYADSGDNHFIRDVGQGASPVTVTGVDSGSRGIIVYEKLNESVIVAGSFELPEDGLNVNVKIMGDKSSGYKVEYKLFN